MDSKCNGGNKKQNRNHSILTNPGIFLEATAFAVQNFRTTHIRPTLDGQEIGDLFNLGPSTAPLVALGLSATAVNRDSQAAKPTHHLCQARGHDRDMVHCVSNGLWCLHIVCKTTCLTAESKTLCKYHGLQNGSMP